MNKTLSNFILIVFLGALIINCANRGNPEGGPKDETPPEIIKTVPENYSTNFKGTEIKITFNEFIKIKDVQKQLIISPPMKLQPDIKPISGASKHVTIKIYDTLLPNTTYAFNFGNSIQDNNEGNPYPYYRYVFSTGDYIDSLSVSGNILDAFYKDTETFVNVGLYEVDSTFTDSIVYKEVPKFVTNTLDSLTTFTIENVSAGKYMLIALKDNNGDNKFQQKSDQIGFYKSFIEVPTDSVSYTLKLFKEDQDFKATRPKLITGEKLAFGYEGDYKDMKIELLSEVPDDFTYRITKDEKTDTLYYWYNPRLEEVDSLIFKVTNKDYEKEFTARISVQERDSLTLIESPSGSIGLKESFKITATTPLVYFDKSKITLIDKDSVNVPFTTTFDTINNVYSFDFKKTYENNYEFRVEPEAFEGFFNGINTDTLYYGVNTRKESDFGYARLTLVGAEYPVIIQLTDLKGDIKYEKYSEKPEQVDFFDLAPGKYNIRVIHDTNGNKKYDTGNYLKKIQPERVSHFEMGDEIRANWGQSPTLNFIQE